MFAHALNTRTSTSETRTKILRGDDFIQLHCTLSNTWKPSNYLISRIIRKWESIFLLLLSRIQASGLSNEGSERFPHIHNKFPLCHRTVQTHQMQACRAYVNSCPMPTHQTLVIAMQFRFGVWLDAFCKLAINRSNWYLERTRGVGAQFFVGILVLDWIVCVRMSDGRSQWMTFRNSGPNNRRCGVFVIDRLRAHAASRSPKINTTATIDNLYVIVAPSKWTPNTTD